MAKQLRIVQDNRYRYTCSSKKFKAENLFKIRLSCAVFPLKCGAVAQWRGGANLAEKTSWWCGGAMI